MAPDWRAAKDAALIAVERERTPDRRAAAASVLLDLLAEDEDRAQELSALVPTLIADKATAVRRVGVALGARALSPDEAESFLIARLSDGSDEVRMEATGQLADLARPSSRGALAAALEDGAFLVRFEAARGMAALKHPAGFDVLVSGLKEDALRFRALGALAQLGDSRAIPPIKKVLGRWLLPAFERTQAAGALAQLGDTSGIGYLRDRARKKWSPDRGLAMELLGEVKAEGAFEVLSALLSNRKDVQRGAAARGLGRLGDPRAIPVLAQLLDDPSLSEELRLDAVEGLCRLKTPEARQRVEAALSSFAREARLEVLGMLEEA